MDRLIRFLILLNALPLVALIIAVFIQNLFRSILQLLRLAPPDPPDLPISARPRAPAPPSGLWFVRHQRSLGQAEGEMMENAGELRQGGIGGDMRGLGGQVRLGEAGWGRPRVQGETGDWRMGEMRGGRGHSGQGQGQVGLGASRNGQEELIRAGFEDAGGVAGAGRGVGGVRGAVGNMGPGRGGGGAGRNVGRPGEMGLGMGSRSGGMYGSQSQGTV
ncbi:unnamed protein product [Closterium sp. Naga37s-1]|nr:unnamed protein product [Closterium sp. Naga37s-1]